MNLIRKKLLKLFNRHNLAYDVFTLLVQGFYVKEISQKLKISLYLSKKYQSQIFRVIRYELATFEKQGNLSLKKKLFAKEYLSLNKLDDYTTIIYLASKWKITNEYIVSNNYYKKQKIAIKQFYKENGYVEPNFYFEPNAKIVYDNLVFGLPQKICEYMINKNDLAYITIDQKLINFLKNLGVKKINKRSLIATCERQANLLKIDSNKFKLARNEDVEIAKLIYEKTLAIDNVKLLTKDLFLNNLKDIIDANNLLFDEPYYLLKRYYQDKFKFSIGNSMNIYLNSNLSNNLSIYQRILIDGGSIPRLYCRETFFKLFGGSKFVIQNNHFLWKANSKQIAFLDLKVNREMLKNKIKSLFGNSRIHNLEDYKKLLKQSNDPIINVLLQVPEYSRILRKIFGNEIKIVNKNIISLPFNAQQFDEQIII